MALAIYLIACPIMSFFVLLSIGKNLTKSWQAIIGYLGLGFSSLYAFFLLYQSFFYESKRQLLWSILPDYYSPFLDINISFLLDPLSLTMAIIVSFVSFLIAVYSAEYMFLEDGLIRFFALVNLFVAFMLVIVLADNLFILFIGWEGVGVCSYLLIGFYYQKKEAEMAAMKAFLTTRIGDIFLLFAIFLSIYTFHTASMSKISVQAVELGLKNPVLLSLIALLFVFGAVGKSAQIPLQVWLPDAMWGPTPISALIHAATMVTAGVYLLARIYPVIEHAPHIEFIIFILGSLTIVLGGIFALVQTDFKRVLAYSTMSQIGYMFLALSIKAPQAAIFHVTTHAFFKALLFLCAGVIGHIYGTYNMLHLKGVYRKTPLVSILFFIGCSSLVGVPFITAGFFSKEAIVSQTRNVSEFGIWAYGIALIGIMITSLYTTRMIKLVFFGISEEKIHVHINPKTIMSLLILAVFSTCIGWIEFPQEILSVNLFSSYLSSSLIPSHHSDHKILLFWLPSIISLLGIVGGFIFWQKEKILLNQKNKIFLLLQDGGGFNQIYNILLVRPYVAFSQFMRNDMLEVCLTAFNTMLKKIFTMLHQIHSKNLTHHITLLVVAALTIVSFMVLS